MNNQPPLSEPQVAPSALIIRPQTTLTTPEHLPSAVLATHPSPQQTDGVHLREYWRIVKRRQNLMWLVILLGSMFGTLYSFRDKSIYTAKAIIEVASEQPTLLKGSDGYWYTPEFGLKTAIQKIQSRPLTSEVVKAMRLEKNPNFLDVNETRSMSETFAAVIGKTKTPVSDRKSLAGILNHSPEEATLEMATIQAVSDLERATQAELIDTVRGNLKVSSIRDSQLLNIEYSHTDPVLAAAIANTIARTFIESNFRAKTTKYNQTSDWLDRTTRGLKAKVEQAEMELANYTKASNIFNVDNQSTLTTAKLSKLHEQATRAEADRILKHSLYQEVLQGRVEQLPEAFSDPKTNELKKRLGELATQAAQFDVKFGGRNPKVVEIRQQMAAIEQQLKSSSTTLEEKLKADYERAVRDEQSLNAALNKAKAEAANENQAAVQFGLLKQNVETAKALYNDFLQKTTQAQAQVAEQYNNVSLIEPAEEPQFPSRPKRLQNILLAILLSCIGGIGLAFFFDYLDNTIKDAEDINHYAGLPTLAMIPKLTDKEFARAGKVKLAQISAPENTKSQLSNSKNSMLALNAQLHDAAINVSGIEAYRILRTSILLSTASGAPKKMLFTSGLPGEGKSTTVINIALSLARLGRSVLLIDADMRRPSVHKYFGIDNLVGLSNYLSKDAPLEQTIRSVGIPNLSLLPSGMIPPNAAELVSSESMRELLNDLSPSYDHILIDSPPLMHVTDALVLSTIVDGVILLVSSGKCTRDVLRYCRNELSKVNAKVLGTVLNNFNFKKEGYGYYNANYYSPYESAETQQMNNHAA